MPVRVLPPAVRAQIAAGEVIERPGSVVKELVENALDAGARDIAVEIEGGGARLIRVRDDGCGLGPEEVPLAFERYGTSKIGNAEDLFRISTLGFRGEALPSIAAVAEVAFLTRPPEALAGSLTRYAGGRLTDQAVQGAPPGTLITVRDLFKDYPARRKFLRSAGSEAGQCARAVEQYALARPDVRFSLRSDGRTLIQTSGSGDARAAVAAVWGEGIAGALIDVAQAPSPAPDVSVRGLAGPPGITRSTRGGISLYINGRWVQNRALTFAVEEAYQGLLMTGRHPLAVLHIAVEPEELDVNIHPRKLEVRLRHEGEVFAAVQRAVRAALMSSGPRTVLASATGVPAATAGQEWAPVPSLSFGAGQVPPRSGALSSVLSGQSPLPSYPREEIEGDKAPGSFSLTPEEGGEGLVPHSSFLIPRLPVLRVVGQVNNTYIIAEGPSGMYLVDQHAAHERVVFERIAERLEGEDWEQQGLLEPLLVEVPAEEAPLLLQEQQNLSHYGFNFEPFGGRQLLFRSLPRGVRQGDLQELLGELAAGLRARDGWQERLATSMACHSAVRAGDALGLDQMRALLGDLEACRAPQTCPHGRPTMVHLSASQLEREFGRRG